MCRRQTGGSDEAAEDARFWGASEGTVAAIEAAESNGDIGIWAEHWDIVTAFAAIRTQWRTVITQNGHVIYLGLDYAACRARLIDGGIELTPRLWDGIQIMEAAGQAEANRA